MDIVYNTGGKYGKQIVQDLVPRPTHTTSEAAERFRGFARSIHWIDSSVVPGSFQMNTAFYLQPTKVLFDSASSEGPPKFLSSSVAHVHDCDEILGFYGTNPDEPYDLGGEIELMIEDEKHVLTKSSLVFVPSGMTHCPLVITRVDRPIFHFSIVTAPQYTLTKSESLK